MAAKAYDDDEEDDMLNINLDLSHEPETDSKAGNSMYPAFQSIDNDGPAYGNTFDENAPMLGKLSPKGNDKIDSNAISVTVTQPSVNSANKAASPKGDGSTPKSVKCWQVEYYQPFFDVDTVSLLQRLSKTLLPIAPMLDSEKGEKPDLYGPFWIVSTLVFLMAAMGNLSRFLNREEHDTAEWESDIKKISEAASLLYSASAVVPLILYFLYRNWNAERGFIELISIYGYSLFAFIPACILCVLPWNLVQWIVVMSTLGLSLWFLIKNLYMPLSEEKRKKPGYYVLGVVVVVQLAIALALKVYFFRY